MFESNLIPYKPSHSLFLHFLWAKSPVFFSGWKYSTMLGDQSCVSHVHLIIFASFERGSFFFWNMPHQERAVERTSVFPVVLYMMAEREGKGCRCNYNPIIAK